MKLDDVAITPGAAPAAKPPELRISDKKIEFSQTPNTDAEGQTARVSYGTRIAGGMGQVNSGEMGSIPGQIVYESNVNDFASGAKTACTACRHWNQKAWYKFVADSVGPLAKPQDRDTIKGTRNRLALAYGVENVQAAMLSMGICQVLTEIVKGWVGEHPMHYPVVTQEGASCPTYVAAGMSPLGIPNRANIVTPAAPFGLFKPKDLDATTIGDKRRDAVLFSAAGK